jgi:thiol-disulfide isomerase/thioredoxin
VKQYLSIIFFLAINQLATAQAVITMHMKNQLACNGQPHTSLVWGGKYKEKLTRLSDGSGIRKIETRKVTMVYRPTDTVSFLVGSGITEKHELFAVADQNRDGDLGNDPVYFIPYKTDEYEYLCRIPLICVGGLPLMDVNSNDTVCLRIVPVKKDEWIRFTSAADVAAYTDEIKTGFLYEYYLSGSYAYKDSTYEIRAIFSPESYMLYNKGLRGPRIGNVFFTVVPKGREVKFATFQKTWGELRKAQEDTSYFHKIDNHYLRFDTIDLPHDRVVITIRDTPPLSKPTIPNISQAMAYRIGYGTQQDVLLPNRPAIVHFSGSWCKPCHAALPAFKKLYNRYKGKYQFATLLAEKNMAIAQATYKKEKITWPGFYEQLSCKEKDCLQGILGVSMFPTYAIIDKNGALVQQVNSVEELEEALQKIEKEAKFKAGLPPM